MNNLACTPKNYEELKIKHWSCLPGFVCRWLHRHWDERGIPPPGERIPKRAAGRRNEEAGGWEEVGMDSKGDYRWILRWQTGCTFCVQGIVSGSGRRTHTCCLYTRQAKKISKVKVVVLEKRHTWKRPNLENHRSLVCVTFICMQICTALAYHPRVNAQSWSNQIHERTKIQSNHHLEQ